MTGVPQAIASIKIRPKDSGQAIGASRADQIDSLKLH
jgi:hypothetical protein